MEVSLDSFEVEQVFLYCRVSFFVSVSTNFVRIKDIKFILIHSFLYLNYVRARCLWNGPHSDGCIC